MTKFYFKRCDPPEQIPDALSAFHYTVHGYIWADNKLQTFIQSKELADALENAIKVLKAAEAWAAELLRLGYYKPGEAATFYWSAYEVSLMAAIETYRGEQR